MRKTMLIILGLALFAAFSFSSCKKKYCVECTHPTLNSINACYDNYEAAKTYKANGEQQGLTCHYTN